MKLQLTKTTVKASDTLEHQPTVWPVPCTIKADPPSERMPWENCRAVPSHQLPHVLCEAGA